MHSDLISIIRKFNETQIRAIKVLENDFDCPRPEDQMDFILRCKPKIQSLKYIFNGYKIRPHGIGMEIDLKDIKIDFDVGKAGEFNRFDAYRLFNFIEINKIKSSFLSEEEIEEKIKELVSAGQIKQDKGWGNGHYVSS